MVNAWWKRYSASPMVLYSAPDYTKAWLRMAAKWTPQDPSSSPEWHLKALNMSALLNPPEAEIYMGLKMGQV